MKGVGDRPGHVVGALDLGRPLRHRSEDCGVVELLKRLPPHLVARDLADEQDEGRAVLEGRVDAHRRVRCARATRDHAHAGPSGELAVGLGHVRRPTLVAAGDVADRRCVDEGVEDLEVALSRNAEHEVDAVERELVDEDPAAGARHQRGSWSACSQ